MTALASRGQLRASLLRWSLFIVPTVVLLGFLSGKIAGGGPGNPWFEALAKPGDFPPPQAFGVVWPILHVLMGLALAMVCAAWGARGRTAAILAFVVQFLLVLAWPPTFFAAHEIEGALMVLAALDVLLIVTIALFWRVRRLAAVLLLPCLACVLFATWLNYEILRLNPGAGEARANGAVQRIEI